MPNALNLLKEDHKAVKELFGQLESSTERAGKRRVQLLGKIEQELKVHIQLEQQLFYPAFKEAAAKKDDQKLFYEAVEEHHAADLVMKELKATLPESPHFAAKASVLKEMVLHHIQEEEREMFSRARQVFEKEELDELGERMMALKERLLAKSSAKPTTRNTRSSRGRSERRAHA